MTKGPDCVDACHVEHDGIIHHGWSCPESDPVSDVLAAILGTPPLMNPILENSRQAVIRRWLGDG